MLEYQTLAQMRGQIGRMIQDTSSSRATKIDEWINTYYGDAARHFRWPQLIRPSEELGTFTASSPFLYLPKDVEDVIAVMPATYAKVAPMQDIRAMLEGSGGSYRTTGQVCAWAPAGESARMRDFYTSAEQLKLTHTDASTSVAAVIQGTISASPGAAASSEIQESLSVVPTTGVTTTNTFYDVTSVSCADLPAGVSMTLTGVTSLYTYAVIAPGETTARYKRIRLLQPSAAAELYTVYYKKRVARLIYDNQSVEIPVSPFIIRKAVASMLMNQREFNAANMHNADAEIALAKSIDASMSGGEGIQQAAPQASMITGYRYR